MRSSSSITDLSAVAVAPAPSTPPPRRRRAWLIVRIALYTVAVVVVAGVAFSYRVIFSSNGVFSRQPTNFVGQIAHLVTSADKELQGEDADRVNILLVGMGGAGHEGSYLSDTIIVASIKPSTGQVALLSIPRDLYVEIPDYGWRKINNANAFGYQVDPKQGGERLLADVLEDILQQPIQYYGSVDFSGFKKMIDLVKGIDITVDIAFSDYAYPTTNFGYQTISFTSGLQKMNGETALKFVRSRHGNNGEGSDFARSKRQQKVLAALKQKVFSIGTLLNPKKIVELSDAFGQHVKTDMEVWEVLRLANLVENIDPADVVTHVLDTTSTGLLQVIPSPDGAYLLGPRTGDYSAIRKLAENIFTTSVLAQERAAIEVQNGTTVPGLAEQAARKIRDLNLTVAAVTNAQVRTNQRTVIYDYTLGQKPQTVQSLAELFQADVVSTAPLFTQPAATPSPRNAAEDPLRVNSSLNDAANPVPTNTGTELLIIIGRDQLTPTNTSATPTSLPVAE